MLGTLPRRHERQFVGTGSPPPSYLQGVRSGATLFLLAAVGILAALALADALRKDDAQPAAGQATTSATTTRPEPPTLLDTLRRRGGLGLRPLLGPGLPAPLAAPPAHGRRRRPERGRRGRLPLPLPRRSEDGSSPGARAPPASSRFATARSSPATVSSSRTRDLVRAARRHPNLSGYDRSIPLHIGGRRPGELRAAESDGRDDDLRPLPRAAVPARPLRRAHRPRRRGELPRPVPPPIPRATTERSSAPRTAPSSPARAARSTRSRAPPPAALSRSLRTTAGSSCSTATSTFLVGPPGGGQPARIIRLPIPARDLVWEPVTSGTSVGPPIRR